jgi:hypothetical protein
MSESGKRGKPRSTQSSPIEGIVLERELIVVAKRDLGLRATRGGVASVTGTDVSPLTELLAAEGATLEPLFGVSEERLQAQASSLAAETGAEAPDLSVYYHVEAPDERLDDLAERLQQMDGIEAAYVKPPAEPAEYRMNDIALQDGIEAAYVESPESTIFRMNDMAAKADEPPVHTPDFTVHQGYLEPAPAGIDARYAWTIAGGRGAGVKILDCEWGWQFTHEDLLQNSMGVGVGTSLSYTANPAESNSTNRAVNHGTAVVGVMGGDRNSFGVTGICPDASVGAASFVGKASAQTIREAADKLQAGDILLLEIHRAGPRFNFQARDDQQGYIAIEWWPDDFAAIRYAVSKGIIVVEAAGNGREDLDDALYNTRPAGFPTRWRNPFNPANPSSEAIVVGAGAPPPGTHGNNHGPDRSRLAFSNWGRRVDCQGWGSEVTTTGYGDLQGGSNPNEWYSNRFNGTSSATPIVAGALACAQGVLGALDRVPLNPARARELLRTTGSAQQDAPGRPATQRIGNRPNLRQMIGAITAPTNLRLIDLEITQVGNERRYSGVFGQGSGGYALWALATWDSFVQKWQELSIPASPNAMPDVEAKSLNGSGHSSPASFEGFASEAMNVQGSGGMGAVSFDPGATEGISAEGPDGFGAVSIDNGTWRGIFAEDPSGFGVISFEDCTSDEVSGEGPGGFGLLSFEKGATKAADVDSAEGFGEIAFT